MGAWGKPWIRHPCLPKVRSKYRHSVCSFLLPVSVLTTVTITIFFRHFDAPIPFVCSPASMDTPSLETMLETYCSYSHRNFFFFFLTQANNTDFFVLRKTHKSLCTHTHECIIYHHYVTLHSNHFVYNKYNVHIAHITYLHLDVIGSCTVVHANTYVFRTILHVPSNKNKNFKFKKLSF